MDRSLAVRWALPLLLAAAACGSAESPTGKARSGETGDDARAPMCTGPLPQVCMVCEDGGRGCAHWDVVGGQCEIAYCD